MVYGPQRLLSGVKTPILTSSEHMIVLISKSTPSSEVCNENLSVREHSAFECTAQHPVEKVYSASTILHNRRSKGHDVDYVYRRHVASVNS